jgi:asparagine synthase (glutamine-hydrolysing)
LKINKKLIQNFLTIRYDPSKFSNDILTWNDFKTKNTDLDGHITEKLLINSIKSSVPDNDEAIAISLSSGIDSSLCLGLLRNVFPERKIIAICGVFENGNDESKIARKIADKFSADFKVVHMNSIFPNMPEIINISKKPRWNTYNHLISKEAKKYSNYLVTGDGADELFGGYTFRYKKFNQLYNSHDNWLTKTKKYLECHNRDWVIDQNLLFHPNLSFNWNNIYNYFKPYFQNKLEPLTQLMLADFNGKLSLDFIPTGKSIFSHYNITGIPIFLDSKLISFSTKLPLNQKYDKNNFTGKLILRKIASRLGVKHIEEKKGFSPSLIFDWQKSGKSITESFLLNKKSEIYKKNFISYDWVVKAFEKVEFDGDIRYLNRLISILALEIWIKIFITHELKINSKLS